MTDQQQAQTSQETRVPRAILEDRYAGLCTTLNRFEDELRKKRVN